MAKDMELKKMEEGLSLVNLATAQRPIPAWEDKSRKTIILTVTVCGAILLVCAIVYSRVCPCFASLHDKHTGGADATLVTP